MTDQSNRPAIDWNDAESVVRAAWPNLGVYESAIWARANDTPIYLGASWEHALEHEIVQALIAANRPAVEAQREPSAKDKVLARYPDARCWEHAFGDWQIAIGSEQANGSTLLTYANDTEYAAWYDAASRLSPILPTDPSKPEGEGEKVSGLSELALDQLEVIAEGWSQGTGHAAGHASVRTLAQAYLQLRERAKGIEKQTATRCADLASSFADWDEREHGTLVKTVHVAYWISGAIRREFSTVQRKESHNG